MFSFSFALILLIALSVNVQADNIDTFPSNSFDKTSLFAQLHNLLDNQNQGQLAQISCYRVRPNIKNAHPTDNTKYFMCRDEQRYEVFTCPNGGIFDDREKACIDLCEQKKPCLNQGQCIILADLTLQCVCRRDWTGERCETPLSTCATNPCGPNGECRMLVTSDYTQDYVCICNKQQSYGRNCQQTVPNPCLTTTQQFHPFAFSRRAYINCDGETIFFQPCNSKLYWNQEEKRCDRLLPLLLRAPFISIRNRYNQQSTQWQNQPENKQFLTNTFMETTTAAPKTFHLTGFSSKNFEPQSNVQPQSWQNNQPFQTQNSQSADLTTDFSRQNFATQSQPNQWTASSFETSTVPNKDVQQELPTHTLRGWQHGQQGFSNQIDQTKPLSLVPSLQTRSWDD